MKIIHIILIPLIAFACVGISKFFGNSDDAGLFGAIIAIGFYATTVKGS